MKRFRFLIIIAITAGVFLILSKAFERPHTITYQEYDDRLVITSKSGYEITIVYDDLKGLRFDEKMDFGTEVSGLNTRAEKSGIWKNEEFGEYSCCADGTVDCGIVVLTKSLVVSESQIYIFNYESVEETLKLHDILQAVLAYPCEG